MTDRAKDRSLGEGVYFRPEDYVGILPRLGILVIDLVVVILIWITASAAWVNLESQAALGSYLACVVGLTWVYLVPLKRSRYRTLGLRVCNCKLVDLQGAPPSLVNLTVRSALWLVGPFNLLFDLVWCSMDEDRQSLRDRYTSMCLVRNPAQPIGTAPVHLTRVSAVGWALLYPRVIHPKVSPQQPQ